MLSAVEQRALAALDLEGLLEVLNDLVAIPSITGDATDAQRYVARHMASLGLTVDTWDLDIQTLEQHPACSTEVARTEGLGIVGTLGEGQTGRTLILNGHVDVVPPGDVNTWTYPPWQATRVDDKIYGRGALDMKGGLCCALFAAKAIQEANVTLDGTVLIQSVIGEEDGGIGTLATVLRGYTADAAVIMEPTGLAVAPAQAGALNFRITVPGLAAHACVREEGYSAIEAFWPIHHALLELERSRNANLDEPLFASYETPYPLSIGRLEAGQWASSVPESLVCEGRFGIALDEDLEVAKQQFETTVAHAAAPHPWLKKHPPTVEWWGGQFAPAHIASGHLIVQTVTEAFEDTTQQPARLEGVTYGSDMRLLVHQGQIPTVLFGPGDIRQAHRPDEFVPIADLIACTRTLILTILRFCGYQRT